MNNTEKAIFIVSYAHQNMYRKVESDKPQLLHLLSVGKILKDYGANNDTIAAGILHDSLQNTLLSEHDIEKIFGIPIYNLVKNCTVQNNNLSWKTSKEQFA